MATTTIDAALGIILDAADPLPAEDVPIVEARGRVLADDVRARADVPAHANSAMDGYAIHAGPAGRTLRIVGESRAGAPATATVAPGEAMRISTGALVPAGADAVVPVERTRGDDGEVVLDADVQQRANIRAAGEDMRAGQVVLHRGRRLGAFELAIAVAAGHATLRCARRPRVALAASGDELRPPGAQLQPGEVHNSNAVALGALARDDGAAVGEQTSLPDDLKRTTEALGAVLAQTDALIVSGGVSVGRHDHVKPALRALGARERFWRVALKPGGPTWFGTLPDGTLLFALPGNPVSAIVTYLLFVRPALAALQGADPTPPTLHATLDVDVPRRGDRAEAIRVALRRRPDGAHVAPSGPQGSHQLSALAEADALLIVEAGEGSLGAGTRVQVRKIRGS